jgi:hypothetical protein
VQHRMSGFGGRSERPLCSAEILRGSCSAG